MSKQYAPATLRNREPIAAVLGNVLPATGLILEVASGTGEHAAYFAAQFPALEWQPSDPDPAGLASIDDWRAEAALANLRPAMMLDASGDDWPVDRADGILCINMLHIAPWSAAIGLMRGAGRLLPPGGPLYLYGPYREDAVPLAPGNAAFDASLKERNALWGLREVSDVEMLARDNGLILERRTEMPANNLSLIFRRS